ncbi:sensor histidine kinase [Psychroflexus aestuariivivens]|uniref:sensor histidine kinase n=1 Tax=Psychroflexus aestuariivivens TaxID=1795040 RepID=UPI000FD9E797|nr:HAMP domain-containing sensor histidine kinase [Psychroflexus aestuariivivens]
MRLFEHKNFVRIFILLASVLIIGMVTWNIFVFYERIKEDEREKMRLWSAAQESVNNADDDQDLNLELFIINTNENIPMFILDENENFKQANNLPKNIENDSLKKQQFFESIKNENKPFVIDLEEAGQQYLYYGNSSVLTKIKYYPIILLLVIFLLVGLIYVYYITSKKSEQNKLWAGMAKETAHQIGTPLSSLVGWLEILKSENVNPDYIAEIEKDIDRLQTITERFSKVGSKLVLKPTNLNETIQVSFDYLKSRSSKLIDFSIIMPSKTIYCNLNPILLSWTIENLTKNAIDAMRGKGEMRLEVCEDKSWVKILISDTGKGIPNSKFKKIFEPGYSTKKRGWGLGLSLSKRIIENYHFGKIKVLKSELDKGSVFEIKLPKIEKNRPI